MAEEQADRADQQKAAAVAARNELADARGRLRGTVARSLMRPLGVQIQAGQYPPPPLSDPQVEALWELGITMDEKVWLLFVEEAIRSPTTTRQLRHRAGFAIQAAVGLDIGRREAVECLLADRLSGREVPLEEKTDLALSLGNLGGVESQTARQEAAILTLAMSKTTDGNLQRLAGGLVAVLSRDPTDRSHRFQSVAGMMGLANSRIPLPLALAFVATAMEPPPEPSSAETLVELLERPLCVGPARRCILDALGTRYRRTFADQWDFVRFATERKLGFDFTSPPRRLMGR